MDNKHKQGNNDNINKRDKMTGKWITNEAFAGLEPLDVYHLEAFDDLTYEHDQSLLNYHLMFRKSFQLQHWSQAFIRISSDDYYKLYINGRYVAQGPAPNYHTHYYYNAIDITDYLREGCNAIAVHTHYMGVINRAQNSGDYRQGLIADVVVDDELVVATDTTWLQKICHAWTSIETTGYDTQFVEDFDSRLSLGHWEQPNYDDSDWEPAVVRNNMDHRLYEQPTPVLQVNAIEPKSRKMNSDGNLFLDFGQEITGSILLKVKGHQGQTLHIMYGEELLDGHEDKVRYDMRCSTVYKDRWILDEGICFYSAFEYKAFRYVEIQMEHGINLIDCHVNVRHYPFDDSGWSFKSSNSNLNAVMEICKNGVKYGTQEGFLDCPSREKGQYLGDITVTSLSFMYLTGDLALVKKTLREFAESSQICSGLMAVAPGNFMQEIADFSLQWPMQLLRYYHHSGDMQFLEEMYPVAIGIIDYFKQYAREDGLLENVTGKWNLVDWPQNLRDDYDFELAKPIGPGCHNAINAFYVGCLRSVEDIKSIIGIETKDLNGITQAFNNEFFDADRRLYTDTGQSEHTALHSNVLPLYFGIAPEEAYETIVELIQNKGLCCGVYMAFFVLKALSRAGAYDTVFEYLIKEDEHSWMNMVHEGATTCFEAWGRDQKWNTSLCHPWASSPISVFIEDILGVNPRDGRFEGSITETRIIDLLDELEMAFYVCGKPVKVLKKL